MEAFYGVVLGAILTFLFNILIAKREDSKQTKKQYIDCVCVPTINFLNKQKENNQFEKDVIIEFIERIYNENRAYITEEDEKRLTELENCQDKNLVKICIDYQEYFQDTLNKYKKNSLNIRDFNSSNFYVMSKVISCIIGIIFLICGVAGALGIQGWILKLYDWDYYIISEIGLCFEGTTEIITFIVVGVLLIILSVFLHCIGKKNKKSK